MMEPAELLEAYDLYDRALTRVLRKDGKTSLEFDLYHCDDPDRSRDGTRYPLMVTMASGDVFMEPANLEITDDGTWGEVIEATVEDGAAKIVAMLDGAGGSVSGVATITVTGRSLTVVEEAASRSTYTAFGVQDLEELGHAMTTVTLPSMRVRLVDHLMELASSPDHEDEWVRSSPSGKRASPLLGELIHFLFDDTPLAENAAAQVGVILASDEEARAVQALADAIDGMLDRYESAPRLPLGEYYFKPEWAGLVDRAQRALEAMKQHAVREAI